MFGGTISGLVVLIGSAFLLAKTKLMEHYEELVLEDQVVLASFLEYGSAVIKNEGYRSVEILRVKVSDKYFDRETQYDVHQRVHEGQSTRFEVGDQKRADMVPTQSPFFLPIIETLELWAGDINVDDVFTRVTVPNDPDYLFKKQDYKSHEETWPTEYKCTITVVFLPVGESEERQEDFDCIGMIYTNAGIDNLLQRIYANDQQEVSPVQ